MACSSVWKDWKSSRMFMGAPFSVDALPYLNPGFCQVQKRTIPIFFAAGPSPETGLRMRQWRGVEMDSAIPRTEFYEALWADLFCAFSKNAVIKIDLHGSRNDSRS